MASWNSGIFEVSMILSVVCILAVVLAPFMANVLEGRKHLLTGPLGWMETLVYKAIGRRASSDMMNWRSYMTALLLFNIIGILALWIILLLQSVLPLNPEQLPAMSWHLALNTAVSFVTNTNWQAYSGEATLSYFSQMFGLGVQNFLSAATGIAVMGAFARGITGKQTQNLGNFWQDLTRTVIYILLPLAVLWALILMSQGVIQNFANYVIATTTEGAKQILPMGPAASQIAIKQLGSNGGGFFGVNSAHPFENPTALSNAVELIAILLIPVALPFTFGRLVSHRAHGRTLWGAMAFIFIAFTASAMFFEFSTNPAVHQLAFMEGKEVRFGIATSTLWTIATTATSNGSVNAMISSMSPMTILLAMLNMMFGEVVFGGVGSGIYGMALFSIVAVFIAGLMVGRSPEYLGKKIEAPEISAAVVGVLGPSIAILVLTAIALTIPAGFSSLAHKGPHGLSEVLYAFSSAAANNGSALAGLNANTTFYNLTMALVMLIGRFIVIIPVLMIAGSLAAKKTTPLSPGTMPTHGFMFGGLLVGTILIIGALTFFPAVVLGPIAEHLLMLQGRLF